MNTFADASLLPSLKESLAAQGLTRPTEIQARTLPPQLDGLGVVGVAETGSGKTLAYVLPMLHRLKLLEEGGSAVAQPGRPRGLVVVPSRELGEQVSKVFKSLTHLTRLRVRCVLGGTRKRQARQNIAGLLEVLVATPGRVKQLLDSGELRLDDVRTLVFDEADQMLDPGFLPSARRILEGCSPAVQLVLFSATLPPSLAQVIDALYTKAPVRIQTAGSERLVPTLQTLDVQVVHGRRQEPLLALLAEPGVRGTLLFANTRAQCKRIGAWLDEAGLLWVATMGEQDAKLRRRNLARFRAGEVPILLATDLAGRGLDIDRVDRVINVHLPQQIDNYLHRVGRTARAGRTGQVVNLVTPRDAALMARVARLSARSG